MLTNRKIKKKLAILRIAQFLIAFLMLTEVYTAIRMTVFNVNLYQNESLRFVQAAEEIYEDTYTTVSAKKADFKQHNRIANLPIVARLTLYAATISLFVLVTNKRNRISIKRKSEPTATVAENSPMDSKNLRVDIAKFYY